MYKSGEKITHRTLGDGIVDAILDNGIVKIRFKEAGTKIFLLDAVNKYITRYGEYCHYDALTKTWYNKLGYNEAGFDRSGIHFQTNTIYDPDGYDIKGYGFSGFSKDGIHKTTGTPYNPYNYDVKGHHKSKRYVEVIRKNIHETCEFDFDGFYHMTVFENLASILACGYLYSRKQAMRKNRLKVNMEKSLLETKSVLQGTNETIKNYVRLYFRPKTPTFFKFQNQLENVVLLKFNVKLLSIDNGRISVGNAGKYDVDLNKITSSFLKKLDCKSIFSASGPPDCNYEKDMRHTEMLVPKFISLKYLDEVIFMSEKQKKVYLRKHIFPDEVVSVVDKYKFF